MSWAAFFETYKIGGQPLFSDVVQKATGSGAFILHRQDQIAAGQLYLELVSRIATQPLDYRTGTEEAALRSLHSLFETTRKIGEKYVRANKFAMLAWDVVNQHVRPFTAKWHRASEAGVLRALDGTDEFRAELAAVQDRLRVFARALLHLRDAEKPADPVTPGNERRERIAREMGEILPWGIAASPGILPLTTAANLDAAEKSFITARRKYYDLPEKASAAGLALSGGGIRSATFSLGVLMALARRGLLPQFDYLSTVSGGGYVGSFLTTYLHSAAEPAGEKIGLRADESPFQHKAGETAPLRHLRLRCNYLVSGPWTRRMRMVAGQLQGMILNGLGLVLAVATLAVVEDLLVHWFGAQFEWPAAVVWMSLFVLGTFFSVVLLVRWDRRRQLIADWACVVVLALLLAAIAAWGLRTLQVSFHNHWDTANGIQPVKRWWIWMAVFSAMPLIAALLIGWFGRALGRGGLAFVAWTAAGSGVFLLGLLLVAYEWISVRAVTFPFWEDSIPLNLLVPYGAIVVAWFVYWFVLDINATSPHRHYRNSLADTFLLKAVSVGGKTTLDRGVDLKLSDIGQPWARAPYHLINCALNVPGTKNEGAQGRHTDFFLFSPKYCGSPLTGYIDTARWENVDPHLNVGTAMAISGAAAAPLMGLDSPRHLRFWLALLNLRLGYWLRRPDRGGTPPGLGYLFREMIGWVNERSRCLYVSDGGHIENLGVYELLRRRCQFIVAVDGEQDAGLTFAGLTRLQRLAKIDLDVDIEIDVDDLRLSSTGFSRSHFCLARIQYPGAEKACGYLLYVKLSLTGNEGEFLRRYRLDEPAFPHHSTADQFFTETQFEAYRSLGEHVGNRLFLKALTGEMGDRTDVTIEEWFSMLGQNLLEPVRL